MRDFGEGAEAIDAKKEITAQAFGQILFRIRDGMEDGFREVKIVKNRPKIVKSVPNMEADGQFLVLRNL